jgi:phospholipid-binding lipoprotein MlaA
MPTTTTYALRAAVLALLATLIGGCATTTGSDGTADASAAAEAPETEGMQDPIEGFNRGVFAFNETLDDYALEPAANAWIAVTPEPARNSVGNFFDNLAAPGQVLNNALQGKGQAAATDGARFFVNSTIGLAGLFDVATGVGLETRPEDFGQTLGVWGVDSGAYLMLPLLGPSSARDVTRYPVSWYTDVLSYVSVDTVARVGLLGINIVNTRAQLGRALSIRDEAALDPYAFTRSSYEQQRRNQIYDGDPPAGEDDPYGDFFDQNGGGDEGPPAPPPEE